MRSSGLILREKPYFGPVTPTSLVDRSRFGNNGAFTNITMSQLPSGLWVREHNSATNRVSFSNNLIKAAGAINLWVYWQRLSTVSGVSQYIIGNLLYMHDANNYLYFFGTGTTRYQFVPTLYTWDMLSMSWTNSSDVANLTLYRNAGSGNKDGTAGYAMSSFTRIGNNTDSNKDFYGKTALLKVWERPVNYADIRSIYENERQYFGK